MTRDEVYEVFYKVQKQKFNTLIYDSQFFDDTFQTVALRIAEEPEEIYTELDDTTATRLLLKWFDIAYRKLRRKQGSDRIINDTIASQQFPTDDAAWEPEHSDLYNQARELKERAVRWALARIPKRHREILDYVYHGSTVHQYGNLHYMEYNAALQLHHRAKKSLQRELALSKIPDDLLRLVESDRMSSSLLQWLLEGPHSAEILCTEIASEQTPLAQDSEQSVCLSDSEANHSDPIDHSLDDEEESLTVHQIEEGYEDGLS